MPFPPDLSPDLITLATSLGLRAEDVDEHFIRGGGHGGQKINKTASMVQLTHHPSGIVIRMQRHREQSKNRLSAWKLLILKLEERAQGEESRLGREKFKIRRQKARRSRKAKEKVLREKHHHSEIKEGRRPIM
jgi:peptide chain release factor